MAGFIAKNRLTSVSIRSKLFFLRIGIGLCMGLIIGAASVWIAAMVLTDVVESGLVSSARLISRQVGQTVFNGGHGLKEIAASEDFTKYYHTGRSVVLAALFHRYDGFERIACLDYQGGVQLEMRRGRLVEEPTAQDGTSDGFKAAILSPNTLVVGGITADPSGRALSVRYYYNRIDYFDNPMGVLRADVPLAALDRLLSPIFRNEKQRTVLVTDREGRTVYGPQKADLGRSSPLTAQEALHATGFLGKRRVYGEPSLIAVHSVDTLGWQTFVITRTAVIDQPLYTLFTLVVTVTLVTILCGEALSRRLGLRIVEPIDRLTRVISKILESGNLTQRVKWTSDDEMGTLAGLFNAMLGKIDTDQIALQEQRTRELEQEVTRRKRDQEHLRKAIVDAEAATRAKSEFLANMSHEIRTPMNGIMGLAELVLDSDLDENQAHLIRTISSEADSLMSIINSILDFSKIEAGKLELETLPFNLRDLMEDLAATFSVTARKKCLELTAYFPPELPESVAGDPGRIRQIMVNLVGNALKFTHEGEVNLWIDQVEDLGQRVRMRFCIKDTGIGIPQGRQEAIFDSFCQADGSATREYGGTGLGTTISKQLVEMMGGTIGLESAPGEGSMFWFSVAFQKGDATSGRSLFEDLGHGAKVLVAEGNASNRKALGRYLAALGFSPMDAEDEGGAQALLSGPGGSDISVVVLNTQLAGRGGASRFTAGGRVPVVLLFPEGKAMDWNGMPGVVGGLTTPVRVAELKRLIGFVAREETETQAPKIPDLRAEPVLPPGRIRDVRILLAEDYPTNQQVVFKHLTDAGFKVTLAEDGHQAVALFEQTAFDLVLMDIQMPVLDGYEATRRIRMAERGINRVPIIAMTAHAVRGYREKCLEAGMDDYITKPLKRLDLLRVVDTWVLNVKPACAEDALGENTEGSGTVPVDMKLVMDEFQNDRAFFMEVFKVFMDSLEDRIGLLEVAAETQDMKTIREQAHTIKGGAANVAAMPLSAAAEALEAFVEEEKSGIPEQELALVKAEFERLKDFEQRL